MNEKIVSGRNKSNNLILLTRIYALYKIQNMGDSANIFFIENQNY